MKKHNFYAGPSILSEYTIKNTAAAVENFASSYQCLFRMLL